MSASDFRFGFRIVGKTCEPRRLVDAVAAFAAHAAADPRCEPDKECYLSAFHFAADFAEHLKTTGSTAGFAGLCWSPWLFFDVDCEGDLERAQADAQALAGTATDRYGIDTDAMLIFFSGSKGFHLGLPTALWSPSPGLDFHRAGRLAKLQLADAVHADCRAGRVSPWPRLFHALRASLETELPQGFPLHVVTGRLGNTPRIALRHYLMTTDRDFQAAAEMGADAGAKSGAARSRQRLSATPRNTEAPARPGLRCITVTC